MELRPIYVHASPEDPVFWALGVLLMAGFLAAVVGCFVGAWVPRRRSPVAAGWRYVAAFGFGLDSLSALLLFVFGAWGAVEGDWTIAFSAAALGVGCGLGASGWWQLHGRARTDPPRSLFADG